jgi:uncharacterized protein (DUF302 family)
MEPVTYGMSRVVADPYETAVDKVKAALQAEGFGVLCEIDVQATLKEKLGIESGRYVILGACNPALAHKALTAEPEIGLFLPCNVVVFDTGDGIKVSAIDAEVMLGMIDNPVLADVAAEVKARLRRVVDAV